MKGPNAQQTHECSSFTLAVRSLLGGIWFALWFFVAFPGALLHLSGTGPIPSPGPNRLIGFALIAAAHLILVSQIALFVRQGGGTPVPFDPPKTLVANGLYGRVRNPMYATYVAIALGEAILYRSWILLAYTAVFALLLHSYVVLIEERKLRARFGALYERYCEASGRWLPRL